jgi:hypothetical protein
MGKRAAWTQIWAYSAAQMAQVLEVGQGNQYKQGQLDALRAVARLESGEITPDQLQAVLEDFPSGWMAANRKAYFDGFQDMYGNLAETLASGGLRPVPQAFHDHNVVYEGVLMDAERLPAQ